MALPSVPLRTAFALRGKVSGQNYDKLRPKRRKFAKDHRFSPTSIMSLTGGGDLAVFGLFIFYVAQWVGQKCFEATGSGFEQPCSVFFLTFRTGNCTKNPPIFVKIGVLCPKFCRDNPLKNQTIRNGA